MKETIENLFEEYGQNYAIALDPQTTLPKRNQCSVDCKNIIKEVTTKIEENVLREVMGEVRAYKKYYNPIGDEVNQERHRTAENIMKHIKSLAESKGIILN